MPKGEGSGPRDIPKGERLGKGLTDEKLAQWGFVVGRTIELKYGPWFEQQNPFKVLTTHFYGSERSMAPGDSTLVPVEIQRGVIVESTKTGARFIVVPSAPDVIDVYGCNPGDVEDALVNEEPPAGELDEGK